MPFSNARPEPRESRSISDTSILRMTPPKEMPLAFKNRASSVIKT
jgi:hypothetical protein